MVERSPGSCTSAARDSSKQKPPISSRGPSLLAQDARASPIPMLAHRGSTDRGSTDGNSSPSCHCLRPRNRRNTGAHPLSMRRSVDCYCLGRTTTSSGYHPRSRRPSPRPMPPPSRDWDLLERAVRAVANQAKNANAIVDEAHNAASTAPIRHAPSQDASARTPEREGRSGARAWTAAPPLHRLRDGGALGPGRQHVRSRTLVAPLPRAARRAFGLAIAAASAGQGRHHPCRSQSHHAGGERSRVLWSASARCWQLGRGVHQASRKNHREERRPRSRDKA